MIPHIFRSSSVLAPRLVSTLALMCAVCVIVPGALSADQKAGDIESTRAAIEKWVETRRVISHEQREWALGKEMLSERIDLVRREIATLLGRIEETEANITKADLARADLVAQNDVLKQSSASLLDTISAMEQRTIALLKRVPEPIRERVKPLSQRLPPEGTDPREIKVSLAERFQNVVGILNEINKFNREITLASEVRALPDGTSAEVTTLYVGIGQGYYVGGNGTIAGYGYATDDSWTWTAANDAAPQIAQAIAMLKNEQVAAFVRLPIEIK